VDSKCIKLAQIAICQERISTAQTKPVICHEEAPNYFLNTFSIHNYTFIRAALPASLRKTPLRVAPQDVQRVRKQAAQQVRQKKAQRASSSVLAQDPGVPASSPPAFDQQPKQTRKRTKTSAPSAPSNSVDFPAQTRSAQLTPLAHTITISQHPSPNPLPSSIPPNGIISPTGSNDSVPSSSAASIRPIPVLNQDSFQTLSPSLQMHTLHQNTGPVVYPIPTPVASHYRPPGSIQEQISYNVQSQIPNNALIGCHEYGHLLANYHVLPGTSSGSNSSHGMHPTPHHPMHSPPVPLAYNSSSSSWGQPPAGYFPSESSCFLGQCGNNVAHPCMNTVSYYGPTPSGQQFH
jgi:hypothetical protein